MVVAVIILLSQLSYGVLKALGVSIFWPIYAIGAALYVMIKAIKTHPENNK